MKTIRTESIDHTKMHLPAYRKRHQLKVTILIPKGYRALNLTEPVKRGDYWLQRNDDLGGSVPKGEPEYTWEPIHPSWYGTRPIESSMRHWIRPL